MLTASAQLLKHTMAMLLTEPHLGYILGRSSGCPRPRRPRSSPGPPSECTNYSSRVESSLIESSLMETSLSHEPVFEEQSKDGRAGSSTSGRAPTQSSAASRSATPTSLHPHRLLVHPV